MSNSTINSRALSQLAAKSLTNIIPGFERLALSKGRVYLAKADEYLCRPGQEPSELIVPISAPLTLEDSVDQTNLQKLTEGRSLALGAVINGTAHTYSAKSERSTLILRIPRNDFLSHLRQHPQAHGYLELMVSCAGGRELKRELMAQGVSERDIIEILGRARRLDLINPGEEIPRYGRALYMMAGGLMQAEWAEGQDEREASVLKDGDWFGGESLVAPYTRRYLVTCIQKADVFILDDVDAIQRMRRLGIVDHLYSDMVVVEAAARRGFTESGEIERPWQQLRYDVSLPGRVLTDDEISKRKLPRLSPHLARPVETDTQAAAASMSNICLMWGFEVGRSVIQNQLVLCDKLDFLKIAEIIEPFGFLSREVGTKELDTKQVALPGLVMLGGRLCVLQQIARRGKEYILHDPIRGYVSMTRDEIEKVWDLRVLRVRRIHDPADPDDGDEDATAKLYSKSNDGDDEEEVESDDAQRRKRMRNFFLDHVWQQKKLLVFALLMSFVLLGLGALVPKLSQGVLDEALTLRDETTLWTYIIGLGGVLLFQVLGNLVRDFLLAEFGYRFDREFSVRYYQKAMSLPGEFHANRTPGSTLTRIAQIQRVREFFSSVSIQSIIDVLSIVLYGIILATYSFSVALVGLSLIPLTLAVRAAFRPALRRNYNRSYLYQSASSSLVTEQISAMATIKSLGAERAARDLWENTFVKQVQANRAALINDATILGLTRILSKFIRLLGIYFAASIALEGKMSMGELFAVILYLGNIVGSVSNVASVFSRLEQLRVSLDKLSHVFLTDSESTPTSETMALARPIEGKIRFENVSFRYNEDSPWVLRDLSFTIFPNQTVALVGRSGCGKTTLAKLIAGNLSPTSGRIFLDGFELNSVSTSARRRQVGFIVQQSDLFSGTIMSNVAFSDVSPSFEHLALSCKRAQAHDFVLKFPARFDTYLAEGGLGLSGGQSQRISIARSLYREPRLILMDEATSALDAASEKQLLSELSSWMNERTAVVIAHRLSTIRNSDRIIVMKSGAIVEDGMHRELLEKRGHYVDLFDDQLSA